MANRVWVHWRRRGTLATTRFLASRCLRHERHVVFDVILDKPPDPVSWPEGEELSVIDRSSMDALIGPRLREFLGGDAARDNLDGVRSGNELFVVARADEYRHCGYILFQTPETKILGEPDGLPLIACCYTAPAARGAGVYRRALLAELHSLRRRGYGRAIIETTPDNIASIKGIEAAGFRLCRQVNAWIVLNRIVVQTCADASGTARRLLVL